ncbi:class II glutamine amidotransferase [Sulfolobales archaeon HS-7]|nr:class II glutamine amidotransferase [Sulfolobales archaeon HS-7]
MCRMFAYYGQSAERLLSLFGSLQRSAERDFRCNHPHDDGWGIVLLTKDKLMHYRSLRPIYDEEFPFNLRDEEMMTIVHARKASPNSPRGVQFSHPFVLTNHNGTYFMAHNGSVDKQSLSNERDLESVVDSELLLEYIAGGNSVEKLVKDFQGKGNQGKNVINLLLLEIRRDGQATLSYYSYFEKNKECYEMFYAGDAIFSSTMIDYGQNGEVVESEKFMILGSIKTRVVR